MSVWFRLGARYVAWIARPGAAVMPSRLVGMFLADPALVTLPAGQPRLLGRAFAFDGWNVFRLVEQLMLSPLRAQGRCLQHRAYRARARARVVSQFD
jgi:hypothetical protein